MERSTFRTFKALDRYTASQQAYSGKERSTRSPTWGSIELALVEKVGG